MPASQDALLVEEIFKLFRLMKENMSFDCDLMKLTGSQIHALIFLKKHRNAQMSEIANEFHIELPSATSLINKLCKVGLAERSSDIKDRRLVRISLTKQGETLLEQAIKERSQKMTKTLSYLPASDKQELSRIIKQLLATMEKTYDPSTRSGHRL